MQHQNVIQNRPPEAPSEWCDLHLALGTDGGDGGEAGGEAGSAVDNSLVGLEQ